MRKSSNRILYYKQFKNKSIQAEHLVNNQLVNRIIKLGEENMVSRRGWDQS